MITIELQKSHLRAMLPFTGDQDIRYYLNGALLTIGNNGARLVATDGHALAVINLGFIGAQFDGIIPNSALESVPKVKRKESPTVSLVIDPEKQTGTFDLGNGTSSSFKFIDGRFPDYLRVIPETTSGETAQFNPALLMRFCTAARELGLPEHVAVAYNGQQPALVTIKAADYFIGVVHGWGQDPVTASPAWIKAPIHKEAKAA